MGGLVELYDMIGWDFYNLFFLFLVELSLLDCKLLWFWVNLGCDI